MCKKPPAYIKLREDLIRLYEIDSDNCVMTDIDWVTEIALLMTDDSQKDYILTDINKL